MQSQNILLVEDDPVIANSVSSWLTKSGFSVFMVQNGIEGAKQLADNKYAAVVLDLGLPGKDGHAILAELRARADSTPVLITTAKDTLTDKLQGLNSGADDYLTKPFSLEELEARLRVIIRRRQGAPTTSTMVTLEDYTNCISIAGKRIELAPIEFIVFQALYKAQGSVVKKNDIAALMAGEPGEANENAAEVYIHRIRKKLSDQPIKIGTVRGVGYYLEYDRTVG